MRNKISGIRNIERKHIFCIRFLCLVFLCALVIHACKLSPEKNGVIVAKVGEKKLYFNDVAHIFPKGCSKEDSLSLSKLFIDNWIKTRLLMQKAELNLSEEQLDISEEIETYRTSLLIYKYEEQLLREKLDTVVSLTEIQNYYEANTANFALDEYVVKVLFLKIPKSAPNIGNVR